MKSFVLNSHFLILFLVLPVLAFSQMRILNNMQLHQSEQTSIKVTGDVLVQAGAVVAVFGDFSVSGNLVHLGSSDQFILKSNASTTGSLIVQGSINGDYTVERYLSSSTWHFLSASVAQLTTNAFYFHGNPLTWAAYYDEPASTWTFLEGQNEPMPLGQGYKFWLGEATKSALVAEMKGALISNDVVVNLSTDQTSWNLIGNPFSSSIQWDHIGWGDNTDGSVYVWDSTYNNGDYRVWNGAAGSLTNGNIPISQSFFVKAIAAGPFNIPAAARTHHGDDFYKSNQEAHPPYVRLQLNDKEFGNTLFIGFPEEGSANFDIPGDAHKMYSNAEHPQIYAMEEGEKLCINANAPLQNESKIVPIYIDQWETGSYTLSLSEQENLPNTEILLEDKSLGLWHDFSLHPNYIFEAQSNEVHDRFNLHFNQEANQTSASRARDKLLSIYSSYHRIYIKSAEDCRLERGMVYIYNAMGQLCYESLLQAKSMVKIDSALPSGNYIVKVIKKSSQLSRKIILL